MEDTNACGMSIAAMFKAAGDPMRLDILRIMQCDSFGVLELCKVFSIQQPSMSHHLKVLAKAGLVATRREGNSIYYGRASSGDRDSQQRLMTFFKLVDQSRVSSSLAEEVEKIQAIRREQAKEFFQENAQRFIEQQDLIASHKDYGSSVRRMLAADSNKNWLEIGPGDGELLSEAVQDFAEVVAIDISEKILERSRANLSTTDEERVSFHCMDTSIASESGMRADVISCNMVLHHVPSPANMMTEMADILETKGQLVVTDLDQHDQDWAREACGDLWLGFSPDQLNSWAESADLVPGRSEYLALRNGFRVQIREYLKH